MRSPRLTDEHLQRRAVVYVRQSTQVQVLENLESQRRQYALVDLAREMGFEHVDVIDDDLGISGSGRVERPGFQRLFDVLATRTVGAVFCLEASRLARNGREWHMLLDMCAAMHAVLAGPEGVLDPRLGEDRLVLGLKGSMSEYELTILHRRARGAIEAMAKRGVLRFGLPAGLEWSSEGKIELVADIRVQDAIRLVFRKFRELGSVRQVMMWLHQENIELPTRHWNGKNNTRIEWALPNNHTVRRIVTCPFYAGAYVWGRTTLKNSDGTVRRTLRFKPQEEWRVLILDNHPGYVDWDEYTRIRSQMAENNHRIPSGRKAGRGGQGLLAGMLRCARCGRSIRASYTGLNHVRYSCRGDIDRGGNSCIAFGGVHVDKAVADEILRAVQLPAIEAALQAARAVEEQKQRQLRTAELELAQAEHSARLAARRYESADPDNRLVTAELERRWNHAMREETRVRDKLANQKQMMDREQKIDRDQLLELAQALPQLWNDPSTSMKAKQQIAHIVIREIIANIDEQAGLISLVIHWTGGRHTEATVKRRKCGQRVGKHSDDVTELVDKLADHCTDSQIAATLNRLEFTTPTGLRWTAGRIERLRYKLGLTEVNLSKRRNSTPKISLHEAAKRLDVNPNSLRAIINRGVLNATQVVANAPWQIDAADLDLPQVRAEVAKVRKGRVGPRTKTPVEQNPMIPNLSLR